MFKSTTSSAEFTDEEAGQIHNYCVNLTQNAIIVKKTLKFYM